jgi:hypothetical protein
MKEGDELEPFWRVLTGSMYLFLLEIDGGE